MLTWERTVAQRNGSDKALGLSFTLWDGFMENILIEAQKTQRLLPRSVDGEVDRIHAFSEECEEEARAAREESREAESRLGAEQAEATSLNHLFRKEDRFCHRDCDRKRLFAESLRQKYSARQAEEAALQKTVDHETRCARHLGIELEAAREDLQRAPVQKMKRLMHKAKVAHDEMNMRFRFALEDSDAFRRREAEARSVEIECLRNQIVNLEVCHSEATVEPQMLQSEVDYAKSRKTSRKRCETAPGSSRVCHKRKLNLLRNGASNIDCMVSQRRQGTCF